MDPQENWVKSYRFSWRYCWSICVRDKDSGVEQILYKSAVISCWWSYRMSWAVLKDWASASQHILLHVLGSGLAATGLCCPHKQHTHTSLPTTHTSLPTWLVRAKGLSLSKRLFSLSAHSCKGDGIMSMPQLVQEESTPTLPLYNSTPILGNFVTQGQLKHQLWKQLIKTWNWIYCYLSHTSLTSWSY